jgi:HEXXH motif-containing protein
LLVNHASEYVAYVEECVRGIISFPALSVRVAEGLIHESSHPLFHFALLDTLFANGQDQRLYYSPYRRADRPIDRILLAFHAFANVALFYRRLRTVPEFKDLAAAEIESHRELLAPMATVLEQSDGLTPDGRAFFEAIQEEWSK